MSNCIEELLSKEAIYVDRFIVARDNSYFANIVMQSFHTKDVFHVKRNDEYFMGIRANNFVVELGELDFEVPISKEDHELLASVLGTKLDTATFVLVTGNHKGVRYTTIWAIPKTILDKELL